MQLQDKTLVVQRAHVGARALAAETPNSSSTPSLEDLQNPGVTTILNVQINAAAMLGALISYSKKASASCVIQVLNLFSREDLVIDNEYLDMVGDIQEEAGKYGRVVSLVVPRPRVTGGAIDVENDLPDSSADPPGVGRVRTFLSFPFLSFPFLSFLFFSFLFSFLFLFFLFSFSFFFSFLHFFLTFLRMNRLSLNMIPNKQQRKGFTLLAGENTTAGPLLPLTLIETNTSKRDSMNEGLIFLIFYSSFF